jgi:c-di-GMP-binding flagellar brake protein YcgR
MEGKMELKNELFERRKNKRVEFKNEAKFRIIGEITTEAISYEYEKAETKNISVGGVCLILRHKITEGNVIRVEIPIGEKGIIKAFCEVQWCKESSTNGHYEAGLNFIALKEDDAEFLNNYVKNNQERAI